MFQSEHEASAYLAGRLSPYFWLIPEVWMQHFDGSKLRMDFAAVPRGAFHSPWFGIEVKCAYNDYRDFTEALRQAVDYRHSRVVDKRSRLYVGERPPFVFVWPDIRDQSPASTMYNLWAQGSERSHGKLKVGLIRELGDWCGAPYLEFTLSASPMWRSTQGICNGPDFGQAQRIGAA